MVQNHKKLFIGLLIVLFLGIIGWSIVFNSCAQWLEGRLNEAVAELRQKGYIISYSTSKITGNLFSIKATLQNPHFKDPQGLFEWEGQEVNVKMRPWKWSTLKVALRGEQKVSLLSPTFLPRGVFHLEGTKGRVHLNSKGRLEDVFLTINRLSPMNDGHPQPLFLQNLSLEVNQLSTPLTINLSFATQLVNLETLLNIAPLEQPLGLSFKANFSGFLPHHSFPKSLAEWRDGGGVLEITCLKLDWLPIIVEAEGTLTLDNHMYPLGSFSSRIMGYQEALANMVKLGWVKEKNAAAASFMLELFGSTNKKGIKQLVIPITLQNKRFSVGPASLFKLKSLEGK